MTSIFVTPWSLPSLLWCFSPHDSTIYIININQLINTASWDSSGYTFAPAERWVNHFHRLRAWHCGSVVRSWYFDGLLPHTICGRQLRSLCWDPPLPLGRHLSVVSQGDGLKCGSELDWWLRVAPDTSLHCWLWFYPHSGMFDVGWANSIGLSDFGNPENASNQQRTPGPRPNRAWRKLGSWKRTSEWRFITSTRRLSRWVDERNHGSARNLWCFWCFLFEEICASEICERNLLRQMFERKKMSRGS